MSSGGTSVGSGNHPHHGSGAGGFHRPPFMSFDPSLEAQRRATQRGLGDLRFDTKRGIKRARKDKRLSKRETRVTKRRGMQDFATQLQRGLLNIQQQRQDVNTNTARGMQDFGIKLQNLVRGYNTLGQNQLQAANAGGVLDAGTQAASASRRASNLRVEKQPIMVGEQRLQQDQTTALSRLGIEAGQLRQDTRQGRTRLRQDSHHDIRMAGLDFRRGRQDLKTQLQRGIREAKIGNIDITQQEIFNARQLHPGAFTKYGKKTGKGNF